MGTVNQDTVVPTNAEQWPAEELLRWALERFHPRVALASSFGAEDMVLTDMLLKLHPQARIFTLDTGRLNQETYDLMDRVRERYGVRVEVYFPRHEAVEELARAEGLNGFRTSIAARQRCCAVRKVEPLQRALSGLGAWLTGLRRDQAVTRRQIPKVEVDEEHGGLLKLSPLADWTSVDVWDYVWRERVPVNVLHARGYPSIGCAPCTRAVQPGEDARAGRWWWEAPEHKECGLHVRHAAQAALPPVTHRKEEHAHE